MRHCKLSPDNPKECSCLVKKEGKLICDVYDEPIKELKKCPITQDK